MISTALRLRRWIVWAILFNCLFLHVLTAATIAVRTAAFYPTSELFRDIYGDFGISYEVEASLGDILWANVSWFNANGEIKGKQCSGVIKNCSLCQVRPTSEISIGNLSAGIMFSFDLFDPVIIYIGAGGVIGKVWLEESNRFKEKTELSQIAYGAVGKLGLNFYLTRHLFVGMFADYLYQVVNFSKKNDIGGIKAGAALGVGF